MDIRVKTSLPGHPKLKRLRRRVGSEAMEYLIRLWVFTADNHPKGILRGVDDEAIADACNYNIDKEPGEFVGFLVEIGWIDIDGRGRYVVHDWEEHQRWIFHSEERKERARKAAAARWQTGETAKQENVGGDAGGMRNASGRHAERNAPIPTPTPTPTPKPKASAAGNPACPYERIRNRYNELFGPIGRPTYETEIDPDLKKHIAARWKALKGTNVERWERMDAYLVRASISRQLTGRKPGFDWPGCTLPWLMGPKNWSKVMGGNYDEGMESSNKPDVNAGIITWRGP